MKLHARGSCGRKFVASAIALAVVTSGGPAAAVPAGDYDKLTNEALQRVLGNAVRVYAARVQAGDKFRPFAPGSGITATDVMVAGTMMMKAVNVQLFEFGMWQAWSGNF